VNEEEREKNKDSFSSVHMKYIDIFICHIYWLIYLIGPRKALVGYKFLNDNLKINIFLLLNYGS